MRKIYVLLILLGLLAVAIFADSGWLNAQTEIQKSFNANSPGQNLQNQLLGSTNTNNTFLNLNGSTTVNALGNSNGGIVYVSAGAITSVATVCVSNTGKITVTIPFSSFNPQIPSNDYTGASISSTSGGISNLSFTLNPNSQNPTSITLTLTITNISSTQYVDIRLRRNVYALIYFKNCSYVATATSYDASFCGATGNVLTNSYTPFNGGVLLAKLTVTSNSTNITVSVSTGVNGGSLTPGIRPSGLPNGMTLNYSTSYNSSTQLLTLSGGSSGNYQHSGELDIYASNSIGSWAAPGQTTIQFQFTITPSCNF